MKTVGEKLGWSHVPPGSRFSSYQIPQYKKMSAVYGPLTLQSINATNSQHPTLQPVPYTGIQFLDIPEFQDLGTHVSEQISAAIAGQQSVASALAQAQNYAEVVGETYRRSDDQTRRDTEALMTAIARSGEHRPSGPHPARPAQAGLGTARPAAAGADLHDRRDADPVPVHALVLDAVLEPGPARVAALRRPEQLHRRVHGQPVLAGRVQHRRHDRGRGAHRDAPRGGAGAAPGPEVPRPRAWCAPC